MRGNRANLGRDNRGGRLNDGRVYNNRGGGRTHDRAEQAQQTSLCTFHKSGSCRSYKCSYVHKFCESRFCVDINCPLGHMNGNMKAAVQAHQTKLQSLSNRISGKREDLSTAMIGDGASLMSEIEALTSLHEICSSQLEQFFIAVNQIGNLNYVDETFALLRYTRECSRLTAALPFYAHRTIVVQTVHDHNVTIIIGETGSGKSTQIAPFLLDNIHIGELVTNPRIGGSTGGKIVVTQPRNLAATELANFVGKEYGCDPETIIGKLKMNNYKQKIGFCTDARLLTIIKSNPLLAGIDCVVVDEVHERSISTDLVLGCLKRILLIRTDLRVVLTSATMKREIFQEFFYSVSRNLRTNTSVIVPVLQVPGRTFPVEDHYQISEDDYVNLSWRTALDIHRKLVISIHAPGDIIVFLPLIDDIERACLHLRRELGIGNSEDADDTNEVGKRGDDADDDEHDTNNNDIDDDDDDENNNNNRRRSRSSSVLVLPLHSKLSSEDSQRVFAKSRPGQRKIIFSTSIAETSVTIDGVVFVIDSGKANVARYDQVRNMTSLELKFITKSSARQRRGRAGRTRPGVCYHLYSEEEFEEMEDSQVPEIHCTNLTQTVLKLTDLLTVTPQESIFTFEFVQRPEQAALEEAILTLKDLDALQEGTIVKNTYQLTEIGQHLLKLDQSPELGRMILYGVEHGIASAVITLASILIAGSYLFYRSGTETMKATADLQKISFGVLDETTGEFLGDWHTYVHVYRLWIKSGKSKEWCQEKCIVNKTLVFAEKIAKGLELQLKELGLLLLDDNNNNQDNNSTITAVDSTVENRLLTESICAGYFKHVCLATGGSLRAGFKVGRLQDRTVVLHPSSFVSMMMNNNSSASLVPKCIIYAELTQTSRLFVKEITIVPDIEIIIQVSPRFSERIRLKELMKQIFVSSSFHDISPVLKKRIIGRRGQMLQELEKRLECTLEMDGTTVHLWTSPANLTLACQLFTEFLQEMKQAIQQEKMEILLPLYQIRSVIGPGCVTQQLLLKNQYRKIILRGCPVNFPWKVSSFFAFANHCHVAVSSFLEIDMLGITSDGTSSWGYLVCDQPNICAQVIHELDQSSPSASIFEDHILYAQPCGEIAHDTPIINDTTLKVIWNTWKATGKFKIVFTTVIYAELAAEYIRNQTPLIISGRGNNNSVHIQLVKISEKELFFTGAGDHSENTILDSMRSRLPDIQGIEKIIVVRVNPSSSSQAAITTAVARLDMDITIFQSLFTQYGPIEHINLFPIQEKNGRGKAYIRYTTNQAMMSAVDGLHGQSSLFTGQEGPLEVMAEISCFYRIPEMWYNKIVEQLISQKQRVLTLEGQLLTISGPTSKPGKGGAMKIEARNLFTLGAVKTGFDQILAGELIQLSPPPSSTNNNNNNPTIFNNNDNHNNNNMIQQRHFRKFIESLNNNNNLSCYLSINVNTNSLRIFGGTVDEKVQMKERIFNYCLEKQRESMITMKVTSCEIYHLLGNQGYHSLQIMEEIYHVRQIEVNLFTGTIVVHGPTEAVIQACQQLENNLQQIRMTITTTSRKKKKMSRATTSSLLVSSASSTAAACADDDDDDEEEEEAMMIKEEEDEEEENLCLICYTNPPDFTLNICGHQGCRSCMTMMLTIYSRPNIDMNFPIKCPFVSGCNQLATLQDIMYCVDIDCFQKICLQSTKSFIETTGKYRFCPNPMCNGILPDQLPDRGHQICMMCMNEYCTICISNDGITRCVPWHKGLTCNQFTSLQRDGGDSLLQQYMREAGGQTCTRCHQYVIRNGGCDHMSCLCGYQFCYQCGRQSTASVCGNPCRGR